VTLPEFITKFKRSLESRVEDLSVSITSGNIKDMEQYRAVVGEIQGLSFAVEELQSLLKRFDDDTEVDRS
jgi:conjugal transfer/entry exclusion protein